jgi:dienelactone hydrolase
MTTYARTLSGLALAFALFAAIDGCAHDNAAAGAETTPPTAAPAEPATSTVAANTASVIETKEVTYDAGGTPMKGFFAYPANASGPRPAVIVVHEWWGLNDYARMRARKLAEMGYVGFALDMYGNGKTATHPEDATKFMMEVASNLPLATTRFAAAKALVAADPRVDPKKIAAIGYCFGGAVVLNMARTGNDLAAVASFHGNLTPATPMKPGTYAGAMLIATGGSDPFVPQEQVDAFKKEMDAAGQKYDLVIYPNAQHAFTTPEATEYGKQFNIPLEYNAEADAASWEKLRELLASLWPAA